MSEMRSFLAGGPPISSDIALQAIWEVDADPSYDVTRGQDPPVMIATRTLAGKGLLRFHSRPQATPVGADTLCVFDLRRVCSYRCAEDRWSFWWFQFHASSAPPCELETVIRTSVHPDDERAFREASALVRRVDALERGAASANFALMFQRWLALSPDQPGRGAHSQALQRVIDLMHERCDGSLSVEELARAAHLSPRRFRQVFGQATGDSPKRFYSNLRLHRGRALLQLGLYSVGEIADRLGYSSPFHFSREFKKAFGVPPSSMRGR